MEKEFVPYEQALALKELGFDEPCLGFYWNTGKFYITAEYHNYVGLHKQNQLGDYNYDSTSSPLYQQAFRWLREKYNLISNVDSLHYACELKINKFIYKIVQKTGSGTYDIYDTYEEAELECLKKLIEIVKKK